MKFWSRNELDQLVTMRHLLYIIPYSEYINVSWRLRFRESKYVVVHEINELFFRLTSSFPWMFIPAILVCKEFIPNFRQIIFQASDESVKWPIFMLYAHAYLYQISFFGGIFMLLFNDEIDDKAYRLWSYLLNKLGF